MADLPRNITEALEALQKYAPEFQKQLNDQLSTLNQQEQVVIRTVQKMMDGQKAQTAASNALKETYGLLLQGSKEAEKTKDELKAVIGAYAQIMGEIKKIAALDEGKKRQLNEQVNAAREYYKALSKQTTSTQRIVLQQDKQLNMQRQAIQNTKELNRLRNRQPGAPAAAMLPRIVGPATPAINPNTIMRLAGAKEVFDTVKDTAKQTAVQTPKGVFDAFISSGKQAHKTLNNLITGYTSLTGQVMNLDQAVDRANKGWPTFAGRIIQMQRELANLGVTTEEVVRTFGELHGTSRTFGLLMANVDRHSKIMTDNLSEQALQFERLGIKGTEYSKSLDILGKTYRSSDIVGEAKDLNTELVNMARVTGQLPGQLSRDFTQAMDTLAAYSLPRAKEIFKDLTQEVASSGVEMTKLLQVAGKFDDMSAAADSVGELNAMLGGPYLNTLDMVNATEAERIQMLKDAMAQQGMNFNQMDRFMQKSIAQQLGVNVQEASRLFRGRTEDESSAIEERKRQMAEQGHSFNELMGRMEDGAQRNAVAFESQWKAAMETATQVESLYEKINIAQHTSAQILRKLGPETRDFIGKHMLAAAEKLEAGLLIAAQNIDKGLFGRALTKLFIEKETFSLGIIKGIITEGMTGEVYGTPTLEEPEGRVLTAPPPVMTRKQRRAEDSRRQDILRSLEAKLDNLTKPLEGTLAAPIEIAVYLDGKKIQQTAHTAIGNAIMRQVTG